MKTASAHLLRSFLLSFCVLANGLRADEPSRVTLLRTPDGGIQPQAATDGKGVIHLIYYKGPSGGGDLFYVRQEPGQEGFSKPLKVNSQPGRAIAAGTIRGAQLALGKNGRVHVAWNGTAPKDGGWMAAPMLYTRLNDTGTAFEPERDVITAARGLDGGGSLAADSQGNVYVFWHAPKPGNTNGEAGRAVFVARSTDDGKTFGQDKLAATNPTGACGCCGMKAFADNEGNVYALYRAASEKVNRAETLLISRNRGADFEIAFAHPWKVDSCPMSSASFSAAGAGALAAWETDGQVYFSRVNAKRLTVAEPVSPRGAAKRKHPVAVANAKGEVLLAWTEGTGWARGGSLAWQIYDAAGNQSPEKGRADGVPVWGLLSAIARPDGGFTIVY